MLSFTEFILEQAKAKSEIKDKYETISHIMFDHLLKTLVYEDKDNIEKYLREMSGILKNIQSIKSKSSYIDKETLKQILFDDYTDIDFKKYIKDKDIDYGDLQKRNLTKKEIFNILLLVLCLRILLAMRLMYIMKNMKKKELYISMVKHINMNF